MCLCHCNHEPSSYYFQINYIQPETPLWDAWCGIEIQMVTLQIQHFNGTIFHLTSLYVPPGKITLILFFFLLPTAVPFINIREHCSPENLKPTIKSRWGLWQTGGLIHTNCYAKECVSFISQKSTILQLRLFCSFNILLILFLFLQQLMLVWEMGKIMKTEVWGQKPDKYTIWTVSSGVVTIV